MTNTEKNIVLAALSSYRRKLMDQSVSFLRAGNQLDGNADWIEEEYGYSHDEIMDFADELAERFEDKFDCNVSENDDWVARIIEMFDVAGRKESNDD